MRNTDAFSGCHPLVNFIYFALVLLFGMFFMHPVCLFISLACAWIYAVYLRGGKAVRDGLRYMLPMFILAAVVNPAFNHEGATILGYLPSGNPITLESIWYGLAAAAMIVAVITWFTCFNSVITSDKFIYLFGRIIPALSLMNIKRTIQISLELFIKPMVAMDLVLWPVFITLKVYISKWSIVMTGWKPKMFYL